MTIINVQICMQAEQYKPDIWIYFLNLHYKQLN